MKNIKGQFFTINFTFFKILLKTISDNDDFSEVFAKVYSELIEKLG
jgi:hypothetical protein